MVELLGVLVAGLVAGIVWLCWRAARALRGLLPRRKPLRAAPLRLARRRLRRADARAVAQAAEIRRLRLALRRLEHERAAMPPRQGPGQGEDRFEQAKRAFARCFHPDCIVAHGPERAIRIAMFKEYWAELRRIEQR